MTQRKKDNMPNSDTCFFKFGKQIFRCRKAIIMSWFCFMFACLAFVVITSPPFKDTGFIAEGSVSDKTEQFLNKNLGYGHNEFLIMYRSETLEATDPVFLQRIKSSVKGLKQYPIEHEIIYPQDQQISADKHSAYVVVILKTKDTLSPELLNQFTSSIKKPKLMTMHIGGEPIFIENINQQTQKDLFNGDMFSIPISLITLLIIFGSITATLVPIGIGACSALVMLAILFGIGSWTSLSIFTLNIASLLCLCLTLDYALFMINRFLDELKKQQSVELCIQIIMATAGKAVFYSGLAVFTSLSALLLFPINILYSIGIGGLVAVLVAVSSGVTLLPALLSVLGHRINAFPVRKLHLQKYVAFNPNGIWYKIATNVVKYASRYFFFTLFFLLFLAYTVFKIQIGISNLHVLPEQSENQIFFKIYEKNFKEEELNPIVAVVSVTQGDILSSHHISELYDYVETIKKHPSVAEVSSIVSLNKSLHKKDYKQIYQAPTKDHSTQQFLEQSTGNKFTVIKVTSRFSQDSIQTKKLINYLRHLKPGKGLSAAFTGSPVINDEVLTVIGKILPYAIIWVFLITYIILLILLRSVFLPFKAIFMNALSLCTSYGVLVYVFQEGHLHHMLQFSPQGILDVNLIIVLFCALFGFSMDYEVFLLTRIHEAYLEYHHNEKSIVFGIVKSSRIITSAALIVIVLCGSYMVADVLMVKEFGLGIAVAIFVDAFAIRTILVPATMALVNKWNWYLPVWLDKLLPKL